MLAAVQLNAAAQVVVTIAANRSSRTSTGFVTPTGAWVTAPTEGRGGQFYSFEISSVD
jgi:hypothetical protein